MFKKIICLVTFTAFSLFTFSCTIYSTKIEKTEIIPDQKAEKVLIYSVLKKSGEKIQFLKEHPGKIYKNNIIGTAEKEIELKKSNIDEIYYDKNKIRTTDGKVYNIQEIILETKEKIVFKATNVFVSIPISEIEMVWVKRVDQTLTCFVTGCATVILISLVVGGLIALLKESCPFIYSFDGEKYIFDAEPYGGATCEGRKRTEWCGLENLSEVNGQYKIKVTNELGNTKINVRKTWIQICISF